MVVASRVIKTQLYMSKNVKCVEGETRKFGFPRFPIFLPSLSSMVNVVCVLYRCLYRCSGQGREEEAHAAHVLWPADICFGEDVRTDKVLGGARAGKVSVRTGHVRESGQGECNLLVHLPMCSKSPGVRGFVASYLFTCWLNT